MPIVFKKRYEEIVQDDDLKKHTVLNNRGQIQEDVDKSCEIHKEDENIFKKYMNTRFNIDLKDKKKDSESWDFVLENNENIHIEYKTIYLKGGYKYANNINDVKIYDLVVIGKDKIDNYLDMLENGKKNNILKTFYYVVGFVYYTSNEVKKIKYMYCYLDLYKISSIYSNSYGFRRYLTGKYDEKPHYQLPKKDFHLLKFFGDILKSHSYSN